MNGLSFRGTHSSAFKLIMRSDNRQMLPSTKDQYTSVQGRPGSLLFEDELEDRFLDVEFSLVTDSKMALRSKIREVARWLYTTTRERLYFDDEPDKFYEAKVVGEIDVDEFGNAAQIIVTFRCSPYALSEDTALQRTITENGEIIIETVEGTSDTPPVLQIQNVSSNNISQFTLKNEYLNN